MMVGFSLMLSVASATICGMPNMVRKRPKNTETPTTISTTPEVAAVIFAASHKSIKRRSRVIVKPTKQA